MAKNPVKINKIQLKVNVLTSSPYGKSTSIIESEVIYKLVYFTPSNITIGKIKKELWNKIKLLKGVNPQMTGFTGIYWILNDEYYELEDQFLIDQVLQDKSLIYLVLNENKSNTQINVAPVQVTTTKLNRKLSNSELGNSIQIAKKQKNKAQVDKSNVIKSIDGGKVQVNGSKKTIEKIGSVSEKAIETKKKKQNEKVNNNKSNEIVVNNSKKQNEKVVKNKKQNEKVVNNKKQNEKVVNKKEKESLINNDNKQNQIPIKNKKENEKIGKNSNKLTEKEVTPVAKEIKQNQVNNKTLVQSKVNKNIEQLKNIEKVDQNSSVASIEIVEETKLINNEKEKLINDNNNNNNNNNVDDLVSKNSNVVISLDSSSDSENINSVNNKNKLLNKDDDIISQSTQINKKIESKTKSESKKGSNSDPSDKEENKITISTVKPNSAIKRTIKEQNTIINNKQSNVQSIMSNNNNNNNLSFNASSRNLKPPNNSIIMNKSTTIATIKPTDLYKNEGSFNNEKEEEEEEEDNNNSSSEDSNSSESDSNSDNNIIITTTKSHEITPSITNSSQNKFDITTSLMAYNNQGQGLTKMTDLFKSMQAKKLHFSKDGKPPITNGTLTNNSNLDFEEPSESEGEEKDRSDNSDSSSDSDSESNNSEDEDQDKISQPNKKKRSALRDLL